MDHKENSRADLAQEEQNQDGLVHDDTGGFSEGLVTVLDPSNVVTEAYRTLRTNLLYSLVDLPLQVVVLTSPRLGEGKSTTCANLGVVLAQADKNVLVLDCDMRRPSMHKIFGVRNFHGLTNILAREQSAQQVWQEPLPGLKVLTAGPVPPNPAELIGSKRFAEFLSETRREFDYVLVDAPPVEMVSEPLVLATLGDGVMLVVDAHSTRKSSLQRSIRSLEAVDAKVLGTIMNKVDVSKNRYRSYQSYTYE